MTQSSRCSRGCSSVASCRRCLPSRSAGQTTAAASASAPSAVPSSSALHPSCVSSSCTSSGLSTKTFMLAAALNARLGGGAAEAPAAASSRNAGPAASSPVQDGGGATTGPQSCWGSAIPRGAKAMEARRDRWEPSTALSPRALANVVRLGCSWRRRASRTATSAASAARAGTLVQFRKALSDLEGGGGGQRLGRSAAAPVTAAAMRAEEEELRRRRREVFRSWDGSGSGRLSLAEVGSGICQALSASYAQEGAVLYHRYYRSFIRAFEDTKHPGDDFVTPDRFARLLANLRQYATCSRSSVDAKGGGSSRATTA